MISATQAITAPETEVPEVVGIRAHHAAVKKLGYWTTARRFDVRASRGSVVLDLLLPRIESREIELQLDIDHSMVKLLVPDGTNIDSDALRRIGRGRVKDWTGAASPDGLTVRLIGEMRNAEVRVHRGGVAILSLLRSRALVADVRQAHRDGRLQYRHASGPAAREPGFPAIDEHTAGM